MAIYAFVFFLPLLEDPGEKDKYRAVFAAVFGGAFFLALFGGFHVYSRLLGAAGIKILSEGGDILKTDSGNKIKKPFARLFVNLAADILFNLVFVLYLIALAIFSASIADEAAKATIIR